jgi:hypothetical protein
VSFTLVFVLTYLDSENVLFLVCLLLTIYIFRMRSSLYLKSTDMREGVDNSGTDV